MKKLNLSLMAILITAALMPQAAFSMEQPNLQNNPNVQVIDGQTYVKVGTRFQPEMGGVGFESVTTWLPIEQALSQVYEIDPKTGRAKEPFGRIKHVDYQYGD